MSNTNPVTDPANVKADPKRPYKAYAGAFVTLLGLLWASLEGRDDLGNMTLTEWLSVIVPTILTLATVYGVTNPKVVDVPPEGGPVIPVDENGEANVLYVVLIVVLVLVLLGVFGFLR